MPITDRRTAGQLQELLELHMARGAVRLDDSHTPGWYHEVYSLSCTNPDCTTVAAGFPASLRPFVLWGPEAQAYVVLAFCTFCLEAIEY
jgi:hypothetical protein